MAGIEDGVQQLRTWNPGLLLQPTPFPADSFALLLLPLVLSDSWQSAPLLPSSSSPAYVLQIYEVRDKRHLLRSSRIRKLGIHEKRPPLPSLRIRGPEAGNQRIGFETLLCPQRTRALAATGGWGRPGLHGSRGAARALAASVLLCGGV